MGVTLERALQAAASRGLGQTDGAPTDSKRARKGWNIVSAVNPVQTVQNLTNAYWASRCLHVVAELGVADVLEEVPRTAAELAEKTGVDADALHRVLRVLANRGIFELKGGRFAHNDASRLLRTGAEGSLRSAARTFGLPLWWKAYGALGHSVRTGRPAVESVTGQNIFAYLGAHPEEARLFAEAMVALGSARIGPVLGVYDFRDAELIGDIGGGLGHLLQAVLGTNQQAKGILFDRPEVIEEARKVPAARTSYVAGDFFRDPIPACDIYLLMKVLHDWPDADSVAILRNVRAGARQGARIVLVEGVLNEDSLGPLAEIDLEMLTMTGGRERTREEWQKLLHEAGLSLQRILPAGPVNAVIEAVVP
jgi:hypothetical protein